MAGGPGVRPAGRAIRLPIVPDGTELAGELVVDGELVWATSDARLLGLGGPQVRGPRRSLHELDTDRITAMAAAGDGGLWLGAAQGLFHVDQSVLRQ